MTYHPLASNAASQHAHHPPSYFRLLLPLLVTGLLGTASSPLAAAQYTFTDLGSFGGDGYATYSSVANGINNLGQVVGAIWGPSYTTEHAMLWYGNSVTDLSKQIGSVSRSSANDINENGVVIGTFGTYSPTATVWSGGLGTKLDQPTEGVKGSTGNAINDAGVAVGSATSWTAYHGIVWNGMTPTTIGPIQGDTTYLYGINNSGQIAGSSTHSTYGPTVATRWDGTTPVILDNGTSDAFDINDAGIVVGWGHSAVAIYETHAKLWAGTTTVDLGTLGGNQSQAIAINERGQVVGNSNLVQYGTEFHAMLWEEGIGAIDLNDLLDDATKQAGWILTEARDINDNGWIVGMAYNTKTEVTHAYRLAVTDTMSVSEPGSFALVLLGIGMVGLAASQRSRFA